STTTARMGTFVFVQGFDISHSVDAANSLKVSCNDTAGPNGYVHLRNSGSDGVTIANVGLTYNAVVESAAPSGSCFLGPDSSLYIEVGALPAGTPSAGGKFTGSILLSSGASLPFSGTFS